MGVLVELLIELLGWIVSANAQGGRIHRSFDASGRVRQRAATRLATNAPGASPTSGEMGWFPDPWGSGLWRWWDGVRWTDRITKDLGLPDATSLAATSPGAGTQPAAAGWYPDPMDGNASRWWNGAAWTERTTPHG